MPELIPERTHSEFEAIKRVSGDGVEFWYARELMPLLGYVTWQGFEQVIQRAGIAAINSAQAVDNHFRRTSKMVPIGSNALREVVDWKLDRYAAYLVAQNADPLQPAVAFAQTYFAVQTRRQEELEGLEDDEKRVFIREQVSGKNKELFRTAKKAGVSQFGAFNDAGYKGLYGMPLADIEKAKGVPRGELLDHAGSTELAANLFRITQTDEKLMKDGARSAAEANATHNMVGGKIRQTIKDIGGDMPERLCAEPHIKEVRKKIAARKRSGPDAPGITGGGNPPA